MTGTARGASPSSRTRTYLDLEFTIGMTGTAIPPLGLSASVIPCLSEDGFMMEVKGEEEKEEEDKEDE